MSYYDRITQLTQFVPVQYQDDPSFRRGLTYDSEDDRLSQINDFLVERLVDKIADRGVFVVAQHQFDSYPRTIATNWGVFFRAVALFYPYFVRVPRAITRDEIVAIKEELGLNVCTPLVGEFDATFFNRSSEFLILAFAEEADAVTFRLRMAD